jgi:pyruvate kinase
MTIHRKPLKEFARTKIVATVGPACDSIDMLTKLIREGVSIFRLNMAHGTQKTHGEILGKIREASDVTGIPVATLVDLAGPKIRLGDLGEEPIECEVGQRFEFVRGEIAGSPHHLVSIYEPLIDEVVEGNDILLSDGLVRVKVIEKKADSAICEVRSGGLIRSRQGINLPGVKLSAPALGEVDISNAIWASKNGIDFISLSFVRNADEINQLRKIVTDAGSNASLVAKIEKPEALENLEEIIRATDAVMVARGDLGVEIDIEATAVAQKVIISMCTELGKPVIVATQMLESMHTSKRPTRAEVSDVANAILDGADACMLSGETAIGEFPEDAVGTMYRIMLSIETMVAGSVNWANQDEENHGTRRISDAVVTAAALIANEIEAKLVVIGTEDGDSALLKSKHRDLIPTVAISNSPETVRKMCMYWGIIPLNGIDINQTVQLHEMINQWAKTEPDLDVGDSVVFVTDSDSIEKAHDMIIVGHIS